MKRRLSVVRISLLCLLTACASPTPAPTPTTEPPNLPTTTPAPLTVSVRVEPIIPADLGDRVTGPAAIYVDAPGAARVEVYVQSVDGPFSDIALGDPKLIGADDDPADGFAVPWAADEPYFAVKIMAVAYREANGKSQTSPPIWILLDWLHATQTALPY